MQAIRTNEQSNDQLIFIGDIMIIHSVFICDNCKITLTNEQVRIITNDARFNKYDIEKVLHYCPICQREADLNFKKYHEIENSDGYGM